LYYCDEIGGNDKLARRPKLPHEKKHARDNVKTLIETRAEGGYIIIAPTSGAVHETGRPYVLKRGSLKTIARITPAERQNLLSLARSFDQMPETAPREDAAARQSRVAGGRPGDEYIRRVNWEDLLPRYGWQAVRRTGQETYWRRPGKDRGQSATTNYHGSDLLYVFTSSTEFDPERGYNKFQAYALLEHQGDFKAAASELRRQGYGESLNGHVSLGRIGMNGTAAVHPEDELPLPRIYADEQDLRIVTAAAWNALVESNSPEHARAKRQQAREGRRAPRRGLPGRLGDPEPAAPRSRAHRRVPSFRSRLGVEDGERLSPFCQDVLRNPR
jgi:hypothetical protein